MNEDAAYAQVAAEIQAEQLDPGLWAKAFAEGSGDKEKAKAFYIRYRAAHLRRVNAPIGRKIARVACRIVAILNGATAALLLWLALLETGKVYPTGISTMLWSAAVLAVAAYLFHRAARN